MSPFRPLVWWVLAFFRSSKYLTHKGCGKAARPKTFRVAFMAFRVVGFDLFGLSCGIFTFRVVHRSKYLTHKGCGKAARPKTFRVVSCGLFGLSCGGFWPFWPFVWYFYFSCGS